MIEMKIPWEKIVIPNRSLRINQKTFEKFPFFKEIFKKTAVKIVTPKKRSILSKMLFEEVLIHGLDENSELIFHIFSKDEIFFEGPIFYNISNEIKPMKRSILLNTLPKQLQNELLDFISRLNKQNEKIQNTLTKKLHNKMRETSLRKFLENPPKELSVSYEIKHMIDIFKAYTPNPYIIQWKYPKKYNPDKKVSYGYQFLEPLDKALSKLKEAVERTASLDQHNISKHRKQELLAEVEKVLDDTGNEIMRFMKVLPTEEYVIELEKL